MTDLISRNNTDLHNNIDLHDAYSLGHVSIEWLAVLIRQIGKEVKGIQKELADQGYDDSNFYDLDKLIAVTNFTADEQLERFDSLKTRFENLIGQSTIPPLQRETLAKVGENGINKKAVKV